MDVLLAQVPRVENLRAIRRPVGLELISEVGSAGKNDLAAAAVYGDLDDLGATCPRLRGAPPFKSDLGTSRTPGGGIALDRLSRSLGGESLLDRVGSVGVHDEDLVVPIHVVDCGLVARECDPGTVG